MGNEKHRTDFSKAALWWFRFGFTVIPVLPKEKRTAVFWDSWVEGLSKEKIRSYLQKHPDHEVGLIVGDDQIVFDADSHEALAALNLLEKTFDTVPLLIVNTKKGEHHYFRRTPGSCAKSDGHSSQKFPDRIDVKTGRALVVLPPSTDKSIKLCDVKRAEELSECGQEFIDAVFHHPGRAAPRQPVPKQLRSSQENFSKNDLTQLQELVMKLDPDSGYEDWISILMAIHAVTEGSDEGYEIADTWSSRGQKYPGREKIRYVWNHFRLDVANPKTFGTLIHIAKQQGIDVSDFSDWGADFEVCDFKIEYPSEWIPIPDETVIPKKPLAQFSLRGQYDELARQQVESVPVLDPIAMLGEMTIIYAEPNTGKTLLVLWLLIRSIENGNVNPGHVYYINADDSGKGVLDKVKLAEEYGFEILVPGRNDFSTALFLQKIREIVDEQAHGCVIILDTAKKFVDLMNKSQCSEFNTILRSFSLKGGSLITLAHTNKNRDTQGNPIHAGTSDMRDDFDSVYVGDTISFSEETGERVVSLTSKKMRIGGAEKVTFSFIRPPGDQRVDYVDVLNSVQLLTEKDLEGRRAASQMVDDADDIDIVKNLIGDGITGKMELAAQAAKHSATSKKALIKLIDRYTGDDPVCHIWNFDRKDRGAMEFFLLDSNA